MSGLVDSIVTGSDRQDVGGILCNDPRGLCVATKGSIPVPQQAGVYTNLVRLASKLQTGASQQQQQEQQQIPPLITLEMVDRAILVKDYAGYAVAVQIPKSSPPPTTLSDDDGREDNEA